MAELYCFRCGYTEQVPDAYLGRDCVCPRCRKPSMLLPSEGRQRLKWRPVFGLSLVAGILIPMAVAMAVVWSGGPAARHADPARREWTPPPAAPGGWDGSGSADAKLMDAAQRASAADVLEALRAGANVNAKFDGGLAPLHMAANSAYPGRAAVVRLLLDAGANVEVRDDRRRTPLHWAADSDAAAVLIDAGADESAQDQDGTRAWPP